MERTREKGRGSIARAVAGRPALRLACAIALAIGCALALWVAADRAQADARGTISEVYGVNRLELVTWLKSHENDDYYLGTPYKPYDWRSPNGDINGWGKNSDGVSAGMNCTGFVWHALCAAHGWKDGIATELPALTGWGDAITNKLVHYTFDTKEEMLASGRLEKGDIIYMWENGAVGTPSDFNHIAIFWGDSSSDDVMWHSSGDVNNGWSGINARTEIHGKASRVNFQVIKLGGSLTGGISLKKVSDAPSVTDGNSDYSLKGAVYGLFASRADAKTHDAARALRTYQTGADGTFESAQDIDAGTYFVAETAAPKGYALDEKEYEVVVEAGKTAKVNGTSVSDTPLLGGISLAKSSANSAVTDDNGCYSLAGAVYGVFSSKADAKTHDEKKALKTYKTGKDGTFTGKKELAAGTYHVAETAAPEGYVLDDSTYKVDVAPGEVADVNAQAGPVTDAPQTNPVSLWAAKLDAETADKGAQGSATLEGALFQIEYYDGYYNAKNLPAKATRTWVVKTDAEGKAKASDEAKVSGDEFYRTSAGKVTIPLGTVRVTEKEPPRGYLLGNGKGSAPSKIVKVKAEDAGKTISVFTAPEATDHVKRGGVAVGKVDRQSKSYTPQGAATLEGAEFQIVSDNEQQVMVGGTRYAKGDVVYTMKTAVESDGRAIARTPETLLPVGTYTVTETASSEGYAFDDESRKWSATFTIEEQGQVADLTDPEKAVSNRVARGDFGFSKVDGQTGERLGRIPFLVTSLTTGESHVIVTDDNGMVSTAASWNAHTKRTNANDAALAGGNAGGAGGSAIGTQGSNSETAGSLGTQDADPEPDGDAGNGSGEGEDAEENADGDVEAGWDEFLEDDEGEAMPSASESAPAIDEERLDPDAGVWFSGSPDVPCAPDDGLGALPYDRYRVSELRVKANEPYELATFTVTISRDGRELDLGTVDDNAAPAIATSLAGEGGEKLVPTGNSITLAQAEEDEHAISGSDDADEGDVEAEGEADADAGESPEADAGDETDEDSGESPETDGADETDEALDEDPSEAGGDEEQSANAVGGATTLVDTVRYENLDVRRTYTLEGDLHLVGEDGDAGVVASSSLAFTPSTSSGSVEVEFTIDLAELGPSLAGARLVAFERLLDEDGGVVATHEDLEDEGQTVRVPAIGTTLTDAAEGSHRSGAVGEVVLVDTVAFRGLVPGKSYTMRGTLHIRNEDGSDAGPALDEHGREISASQAFTPESPDGEVKVTFAFAAPELAGTQLVAFEELYRWNTAYAVHADITDESQTVELCAIGTTLADAADGDHEARAEESVVLVDTVAYQGLVPGATYLLDGTLHVRSTGGEDLGELEDAQGEPISATAEFAPESPSGQAQVVFTFSATSLAGASVVAFEELSLEGVVVAVHADIADEGQTVSFPPSPTEEGEPPADTPPEEETPPADVPPEEEPPEDVPPEEVPPSDNPPTIEVPPSNPPAKGSLPKTGDLIGYALLALAATGAIAAAALAWRSRAAQRQRARTCEHGPHKAQCDR